MAYLRKGFGKWWDAGVGKPVSVGRDCAELAWAHQQKEINGLVALLDEYVKYNGEYASSMPPEDWVARVQKAVNKAKGV